MSRTEPVHTSRRLRLRGRHQPADLDGAALDELAACLDDENIDDDSGVDAVELAFDGGDAGEAFDALERLVEAGYDVDVRDLVVEIRR